MREYANVKRALIGQVGGFSLGALRKTPLFSIDRMLAPVSIDVRLSVAVFARTFDLASIFDLLPTFDLERVYRRKSLSLLKPQ